jgi:tetratricopeptide (TPR) repeat protein
LKDDKNLDKFPEIRYELALCYERQDRLGKAIDLYYEIIRRHKGSIASSASFYRLGLIKRDISHDYYRAKVFFDSSRVEQGQGEIFQLSTQAALTMGKILDLEYSIHSIDSVLKLGIQLPQKDTTKADSSKLAKKTIEQTVQRRTRADYRRSTFLAEGGIDAFSQAAPTQATATVTIVRQVYPAATDSAGYEKYKKDRLSKRFELANFYHISFSIPDSALAWYYRVLMADSLTSPKALADITELTVFSIADIYRSISDSAKVDSLYRLMIDKYPLGKYTNEARRWFGQTIISQRDLTPEKALLAEADSSNEFGRGPDALKRYQFIVTQYPNSPFVPKALLGVGYTFEKTLHNPDSAIIAYRMLASKFPNSAEAKFIAPKMAAIKVDSVERKRIADSTAKADSLTALQLKLRLKAIADSTAKADSLFLSHPKSPSTPVPSDTTRKPLPDIIEPKTDPKQKPPK